eukprot:CAMPEP_0196199760 /NCGR_PEP_ID=MMETSP0912-20130531/3323_1 /TAXON_ID=49265 /ORGANISM="Thalassiosira rotula, Strain GSO102" /LENGTH=111 /DNA_ID=CAMNT_0041473017 /DNA_START=89 /DNA_END=420 /DNA_ORIENTATION=-
MQFLHHFVDNSTRDFFANTCLKEQSGSSQYPTLANTGQISASQRTFTCRKGQSSPLEHMPFLWKKTQIGRDASVHTSCRRVHLGLLHGSPRRNVGQMGVEEGFCGLTRTSP